MRALRCPASGARCRAGGRARPYRSRARLLVRVCVARDPCCSPPTCAFPRSASAPFPSCAGESEPTLRRCASASHRPISTPGGCQAAPQGSQARAAPLPCHPEQQPWIPARPVGTHRLDCPPKVQRRRLLRCLRCAPRAVESAALVVAEEAAPLLAAAAAAGPVSVLVAAVAVAAAGIPVETALKERSAGAAASAVVEGPAGTEVVGAVVAVARVRLAEGVRGSRPVAGRSTAAVLVARWQDWHQVGTCVPASTAEAGTAATEAVA